jgi:hypothetical protein
MTAVTNGGLHPTAGIRPNPMFPAAILALVALWPGAGLAAAPQGVRPENTPPLIRSARSGPWSVSSTWEGGRVPPAGARVQIRPGHTVRYDLNSDQAIRSIHVGGVLTFARDRDTRLDVGLIKIQAGEDASENGFDCDAHVPAPDPSQPRPSLEVGTAEQPIDPRHTARIRLVYFEGMDRQSCPAIVCCGGRMEFHGAPMDRTWVKLGTTAQADTTVITLAEPVTGWRVGDHIILTATQRIPKRTPTGFPNGTFRSDRRPVRQPDGDAKAEPTQAAPAVAAREAGLLAEIAAKFALGAARGPVEARTPRDQDPGTSAWVAARVALWAAETARRGNAPGRDAAVAAVVAARTALQAAETAGLRDTPKRSRRPHAPAAGHGRGAISSSAETSVAAARTALAAAETALVRNAPNREAVGAGIAAARAAIAAAEAANIPTAPDQEAAAKASLLEIAARERERRPLEAFTEERTIRAIDYVTLTLDRPLVNTHRAVGPYRGEVADLSRNVIVESADPAGERGHTMYHRGSAGSISYAEFRHLGKEGVLGRYSLHFHRVGDTMRGSSVIGASIWDSHNRWLTIHGTNYLVVRDCIGYQSVGHGFYVEDGTEVYNVFDRNLAVQAYGGQPQPEQILPFDTNGGAGFWWANCLNTFTRNVACECDGYGYRFEATPDSGAELQLPVQQPDGSRKPVDIRTLPFVRFENNEAHTLPYGLNLGEGVDNVGPDPRHPLIIRNTRLWNAQWAFRPNSPSMIVEDMAIYGSTYGVFQPIYDHHAYARLAIDQTEFAGGSPQIISLGQKPEGMTFPDAPSNTIGVWYNESADVVIAKGHAADLASLLTAATTPDADGPLPTLALGKTPAAVEISNAQAKTRLLRERGDPLSLPLSGLSAVSLSSTAFPSPLDPVDDLPPASVITFTGTPAHGKLVVRGTTSDNGTVTRVLVNGQEATPLVPNFAEWEITLDHVPAGMQRLTARAEDAAGNVERSPHEVEVAVP